jgi:CDP-glucose 4,6-dehydratase
MSSNYWRGKNVLITGINGFIGGNLAKKLIQEDANVIGLVRNDNRSTFLHYENLLKKTNVINGDLIDKNLLARIVSEEQITNVFHLAAQVEVGVGVSNPYLTFETNIKGTYCLLEAIRQYSKNVRSIVVASTDKAYGQYGKDEMPYKEDYPLLPRYPYDTSKACADMISRSYASDIFKLPIVVTRFCNIYGPGQLNFSALVPDAIRSALGFSTFIPRGDGSQIRDFLFVDDVVDLYLKIGQNVDGDPNKYLEEIFNAGSNSPKSVKSVIIEVFEAIGNKDDLDDVLSIMNDKHTIGEIDCQYMDFEKVSRYFGWEPKHSFTDGLRKTIKWYSKYLKRKYEK